MAAVSIHFRRMAMGSSYPDTARVRNRSR